MNTQHLRIASTVLLLSLLHAPAAVLYVDVNGTNPTPPYTDWSTAATVIQDAVDAASPGDRILVTNGIYQVGGRPAPGEVLTNRVLVTTPITLQSVNGPQATVIIGCPMAGGSNSDVAVRCAYLADGTQLSGFTLADGATRNEALLAPDSQGNGGGAWCQSTNVLVSNCIILSNMCSVYGAGVYSGTVKGCLVAYNSAWSGSFGGGGGLAGSVVSDSTIRSNYTSAGNTLSSAGAWSCVLSNCIVEGNLTGGAEGCSLVGCSIQNNTNSSYGGGVSRSVLDQCTIWGNCCYYSGGGAYNCVLNNCSVSNNWATQYGGGVYADNTLTNWIGANTLVCSNTAQSGGGVYLVPGGSGRTNWNLVNWQVVSNTSASDGGGVWLGTTALIQACTFAGNSSGGKGGGAYLSNGALVRNCTFTDNTSVGNGGGAWGPVPYGASAFVSADSVFEGNRAGGDGGGAWNGGLTNCLVVGNHAVNGGGAYGIMTNCVVTDNVASGNGGGLNWGNPQPPVIPGCCFTNNSAVNGGGVYGGSYTNCVFSANLAATNGGGAYGASLHTCLVISNQAAYGGGAYDAGGLRYPQTSWTFINSRFLDNSAQRNGGGLYFGAADPATNCVVAGNTAAGNGGGSFGGVLGGCTFGGNSAGGNGGGAYNATLSLCVVSNNNANGNGGGAYNSTIGNNLLAGNSAAYGGGFYLGSANNSTIASNQATLGGGGAYYPSGGTVTSCILYNNTAPSGPNYAGYASYNYCCTTPLPSVGGHNLTSDPGFVNLAAGNYRLQTNSPCINAGNAVSGSTGANDLDGRPRVVGGLIDIGVYEFQGAGMGEFIAWLQQYGLPTGGTADYIDSDHDGMNNWQEFQAGTNPTNALSVLKLLSPVVGPAGVTVNWQSVTDRTYYLQGGTNLAASPAFFPLQSNIVGQVGTTSFTDATATNIGPYFYRVGVQ